MHKSADFVIIGAGSAGCVLADALSKNGQYSVIVLEAGPKDDSSFIEMPRGLAKLLAAESPYVDFYDVDRGGNFGKEPWLKGRTLGGSSSINGMVYVRGFPQDYDAWEKSGCTGWGWDAMHEALKSHEDHALGANEWRGVSGPLKITPHNPKGPSYELGEAILNSAVEAGIQRVDDTNAHPKGSIGYQTRNIWKGKRQSAAKAFLRPAEKRPNVTVISEAKVEQILFEGTTATGVRYVTAGQSLTVTAKKEVIVSAGAIETPKLLQVSGVGPSALLKNLGVNIIVDVPEVGENLREHMYIQCKFGCTSGSLNNQFSGLKLFLNVIKYFAFSKGPMTHAAQEMIGYVRSRPDLEYPDCQIGVGLYSMHKTNKGLELDAEPGFTIGGYYMHPKSTGSVKITSSDIKSPPDIVANYLQHPDDRRAAVNMIKQIRHIVSQPALQSMLQAELAPGPKTMSDEDLLQYYIENGTTAFHVSGTCRMGKDKASVVDPRTRVRGTQNLRVVDTSIFPSLPSGNTNAPVMAAARIAAHKILEDLS